MSELTIFVGYTQNSGDDPALGLALADIALYLTAVHKTTGALTVIWDGTQNPTFEVTNTGTYGRIYATADLGTYNYSGGGLYSGGVALDNDWVTSAAGMDIDSICACVTEWFAKTVSTLSTLVTGEVTITRGDTLILQFEGIGDITLRDNIWFTVKGDKDDADTTADIQIDETNGLLYINGVDAQAAGWVADASITVTDAVAGDLTVRLEAVQSAKITTCSRNWYDLQVSWLDGTVSTLSKGIARVIGDLTRATS